MSDLEIVRKELLERGDEMVSFRQLVERFDEIEKVFGNTPWNLEQIYSNFNILIGKEPSCDNKDVIKTLEQDCVSRKAVEYAIANTIVNGENLGYAVASEILSDLPPVTPSEKDENNSDILNKWIGAEVLDRIRNELHATAEKHEDGVYYLRDEWIDEVFDKYKG